MLTGLIDTYMLGDPSATVLAAVSLTSSAQVIFYSGLYGFVGPIGILAGQAMWARRRRLSGMGWY